MTDDTQGTLDGAETPGNGAGTHYVVQVLEEVDHEPDDVWFAWRDVAEFTVSPRTHRETALKTGLKLAGIELTPDLQTRLLDAENAYVWRTAPPKTLRLL